MNDRKKKYSRKKYCKFCANKDIQIDYKNIDMLKQYISEVGKIEPARLTGTCAKHNVSLPEK